MPKNSLPPSDDDKIKALADIRYEFEQLAILFLLAPFPLGVLGNARLEALLVHVRLLLSFFKDSTRKRGLKDVLAADYGFKAKGFPFDNQKFRDRLNQDLAHLSYERTRRLDKRWRPAEFVPVMLVRCKAFADMVVNELLNKVDVKEADGWRGLVQLLSGITVPGFEPLPQARDQSD